MSEYIDLVALKEAIGLTGSASDTVDDGLLRATIWRASAVVDNYLFSIRPGHVGFGVGSNSRGSAIGSNTRTYDGSGSDTLFIDDADSVGTITVDDVEITRTSVSAWPYNEKPQRALIYNSPVTSLHGLLVNHWTRGTANVGVTAYWGGADVPDDVAQTTLALSVLFWRRYQSGDPAPGPSTAMGGRGSVTNDPEVQGILEALWPRWAVPYIGGA